MSELPTGWSLFSMRDLGGLSGGKTPSKANPSFWSSQDIPWVSPKDMKINLLEDTEDRISQSAIKDAGMTLYPSGSILMVTRSGILQHTFPVALAGIELTVNQDIKVLRPVEGISPQFAFYLLKSFGDEILSACSKDGTTVQSIDSEKIEAFSLPLPPAAEQTRIAAKLDELLAQVDTLKARIDGIPALLKRFRQSVLAAAVSGRLMEEWRQGGNSERKFKKLGEARIEVKTGPFGSALHKSDYINGAIPVINPMHISEGKILPSQSMTISEEKYKTLDAWHLKKGDVVIGRRGEMGRAAVVKTSEPKLCGTGSMILRTDKSIIPKYLEIIIRSPTAVSYFNSASVGSTMINLNQNVIKNLEIYLPALVEQTEIIRRVEQLFAFADQLEARVKAAQARIDRLTQSILAKAFRGELVPQDPNDEPASVLLERIKAQRAAEPKAKRGRGAAKLS